MKRKKTRTPHKYGFKQLIIAYMDKAINGRLKIIYNPLTETNFNLLIIHSFRLCLTT